MLPLTPEHSADVGINEACWACGFPYGVARKLCNTHKIPDILYFLENWVCKVASIGSELQVRSIWFRVRGLDILGV